MNRLIKFRGKIKQGKWIYGNLLILIDNYYIVYRDGTKFKVIPETVVEYTRKQDMSIIGKEIYMNSVIMMNDNRKDLGIIKFGEYKVYDRTSDEAVDSAYGYYIQPLDKIGPFNEPIALTDYYIKRVNLKVIGNTIDNPELLEDK